MAGMSFLVRLALCTASYAAGSIFSLLFVLRLLIGIIRKGPSALFHVNHRPTPPACMLDPSLGIHGYAYLEDIRLHYVSNGAEDKPLMLLVHGFPEFWYTWRHQLREFKDKYRVVAIDQRGYGDSDKPDGVFSYNLLTLTSDIRQFVQALGYKKCVLVGHDWGGIVAWAFAQTCPDMVERFIVMNAPSPAAFLKRGTSALSQLKKSWYVNFFQIPYVPEMYLRLSDLTSLSSMFRGTVMGVQSGLMTEEDVEAYKFTFQRNGFTKPLNYYRALVRYPEFPFYRLTRPEVKVTCPTLIIWGCKDGALDTELAALSAETVSAEIKIKYIEDSSHWTPMDRPELVNQYMREFLENDTMKKSQL